jgi:hypothetical protein
LNPAGESFFFLSEEETRFFGALCDLMIPAGNDPIESPGSMQVGGLSYIDSTLSESPKEVQDYFKGVVKLVNQTARRMFLQRDLWELSDSNKDSVLRSLFLDPITRERVFDLRSLVLESFYSDYHDPSFTGKTAWEVVGFTGKRISGIKKDWSFLRVWREAEAKQS